MLIAPMVGRWHEMFGLLFPGRVRSRQARGWGVCRMHGAGGGGPSGRRNGNYRHGGRTKGITDAVRYINALAKKARDLR
jgi:hypothetical protein